MNPWPISPLSQKDLDFNVVNYDFVSFIGEEQSELPGLGDAIDSTLLDFAASIADQTTLVITLFDGFDDLLNIPGEIASSDDVGNTLADLSNAAAAGDAVLGDYAGQIGDTSGGSGSGTGSGGTGESGCTATGQGPISPFTGVPCTVKAALPKVCVSSNDVNVRLATTGQSGSFNTITDIERVAGDATLFKGAQYVRDGSSSTGTSIEFTLTPTKAGHFDAQFRVTWANPTHVDLWCVSVDVISQ